MLTEVSFKACDPSEEVLISELCGIKLVFEEQANGSVKEMVASMHTFFSEEEQLHYGKLIFKRISP